MFPMWFAVLIGAYLGITATRSRTFSNDGGVVLLFIAIIAFAFAGLCGVLTPFVPDAVGVWLARCVVFCVTFIVATIVAR